MADGSITFSTELDNKDLIKQLKQTEAKIESLKAKLNAQSASRSPVEEKLDQITISAGEAGNKLAQMKEQLADAQAIVNHQNPNATIEENMRAMEIVKDMPAQIKAQEKAYSAVRSEVGKLEKQLEKADAKNEEIADSIRRQEEAARDLRLKIVNAADESSRMGEAADSAGKCLDKFMDRVKGLTRRVLVFSVITMALRAMRDWMAKVVKTSAEASQALARLKGAVLTFAQPLVEVLVPALTVVFDVLSRVVLAVAKFMSLLFGKTLKGSQASAAALYKQTEALDGVGKAAKDAGNALAGFDDLNVLDSGETNEPSFESGVDFSGSEGITSEDYKKEIDKITLLVSGALLALGAILAFSGLNIPLGIGLMAIGAAALVSVAQENWTSLSASTKETVNTILVLLSGALLVLGGLLALSGINIPLGLGLMAAGAATLAAAAVLNWGTLTNDTQGSIEKLLLILGSAALALGAILAFSGVNIPLGIGLMAIGAASCFAAAKLGWDTLDGELQRTITKTLVGLGAFVLVLGAILAFSGAAIPLGIGMMVAGGASLAAAVALNWNAILEHLKGAWMGIKTWWTTNVAPCFTVVFWQEKFDTIRAALVQKIKDAVNSGIALFNQFVEWINEKLNISWDAVTIGGKEIIPAGSFQLFTLPTIPYLAQGAVIPANREFLAVLGDQKSGTNVEAPLSVIRQAVREELAEHPSSGGDIILQIDGKTLARITGPYYDAEKTRRGVKLVTGGAT